jgi:ribonuclease Z
LKIKQFHYFGTGAGLPSLFRNVSAMAVDFENEWFLFDCGEGTQQSIIKSPYKMSRLTHIFISHFHGDHLYGLPGLIATMQLQGIDHDLTIIAPKGIQAYLDSVFQVSGTKIKRQINFIELDPLKTATNIYTHSSFTVKAITLSHRITCFGYRLEMRQMSGKFDNNKANELGIPKDQSRKMLIQGETITLSDGRTIQPSDVVSDPIYNPHFTYVTDTRVCPEISELAHGTDYLHHECTFSNDEEELAEISGHCTVGQVLDIAEKAEVKQLHLAHFSSRHDKRTFRSLIKEKPFQIFLTKDDFSIEARL